LEIDAAAGTISVGDLERSGANVSAPARRSFELPATVRVERISPEETGSPTRRRFLFSPDGGAPAFEIVLGNDRRQTVVTSNPLTGFPRITEL
jgi:hypothetical protein